MIIRIGLALLLLVAAAASAKVHVLTEGNFEHDTQATTGATTGPWFVKFHAPWCGCKALLPVRKFEFRISREFHFRKYRKMASKSYAAVNVDVEAGGKDAPPEKRQASTPNWAIGVLVFTVFSSTIAFILSVNVFALSLGPKSRASLCDRKDFTSLVLKVCTQFNQRLLYCVALDRHHL